MWCAHEVQSEDIKDSSNYKIAGSFVEPWSPVSNKLPENSEQQNWSRVRMLCPRCLWIMTHVRSNLIKISGTPPLTILWDCWKPDPSLAWKSLIYWLFGNWCQKLFLARLFLKWKFLLVSVLSPLLDTTPVGWPHPPPQNCKNALEDSTRTIKKWFLSVDDSTTQFWEPVCASIYVTRSLGIGQL